MSRGVAVKISSAMLLLLIWVTAAVYGDEEDEGGGGRMGPSMQTHFPHTVVQMEFKQRSQHHPTAGKNSEQP